MTLGFHVTIGQTANGWQAQWEIRGSQSRRRETIGSSILATEADACEWLNECAIRHGALQVQPEDLETKVIWDSYAPRRQAMPKAPS
jgi:hypothetical protein